MRKQDYPRSSSWCVMFTDDIISADESRDEVNAKLDIGGKANGKKIKPSQR